MGTIEPVLVALLFADRVIVEHQNMKKTIVGTFTRFHTEKFPALFAPWFIFAAATHFVGRHPFSLDLTSEAEKQGVIAINGEVNSDDVNKVNEFIFPINKAIFPGAGMYILTFKIGDVKVGSRLLEVVPQAQTSGGE